MKYVSSHLSGGFGGLAAITGISLAACASTPDASTTLSADASRPDLTNLDGGLDADADSRIGQLLSAAAIAVHRDGVVGAGIALVVDGRLAYAGGIGERVQGEAPVDGDTLFLLGSTTKMLTVATVLSLVQDGKLDLKLPITTYLPHLTVESPFDVHDMTLSRLLSHTDALEDDSPPQCALPRFSDYGSSGPVTLWGTPGTFFDYSNNDMAIAAQAIESVTGPGSYERTVHDRAFSPAGMGSTTFDAATAAQSPDVATGYLLDASGGLSQPQTVAQVAARCPILEPAGNAIASARDLGKFVETLLAGGGSMLRPESVALMETGVMATGFNSNYAETYGYGEFIEQMGGQTVIQHGGDEPPFHSLVVFVPQTRFGFVMLVNTDSRPTLGKVSLDALRLFSPPPGPVAPPIKTEPSAWQDYVGSYVDPYGSLGEFSVKVQDASLVVQTADGGFVGSPTQLNGDLWTLPPSLTGVFWRDDAGTVQQIVTRAGVAVRQSPGGM